jgi:hypothetical protein
MASPDEHKLTFLRGSGFLLSLVGAWDLMADESSQWPSQKGFLIFKETKIIAVIDLYSAYCRKGWGGRVRQNLPPGHANFNRRLFLTTLAIKRSESFSKLHENRP